MSFAIPATLRIITKKGTDGIRRKYLKCTQTISRQGVTYTCEYLVRKDNYHGQKHKCPQIGIQQYLPKPQSNILSNPIGEIEQVIADFFGNTSQSINLISSPQFAALVEALIQVGQRNPSVPIRELMPTMTRDR